MPQAAGQVIDKIKAELLQPAALVIFSAGFLLFIWGLVVFLWHIEDGSAQEEGKDHMIWGIVGMFIMISIWSIIALIDNTLGFGATTGGSATDPSRADSIGNVQFR